MKTKLNVTALQIPLFWENAGKNRVYIDRHFDRLNPTADIVLLPELFSTGFTMNSHLVSESMNGITIQWMQSWAAQWDVLLGGSLVIEEEGKFSINEVSSDFFAKEYFAARPASERLVNKKLELMGQNKMSPWKLSLNDYVTGRFIDSVQS